LVAAWRAGLPWQALSAMLVAAFLVQSLPVAWRTADWYRRRGEVQRELVMGVARAHDLHPGKVILLDGVNDDLFWGAISQRPFLFLRIPDVYLTPGSQARITPHPELDDVAKFVLPADETRRGLDHDDIVVYRTGPGLLKNITHRFEVPADLPQNSGALRIDMADPLVTTHLGPTWYPREEGFRWMPRTASVRMPGPRTPEQKLYITAICPAAQLQKGPLDMTVTIDSVRLGPVHFTKGNVETTFNFAVPAEAIGKQEIEITLELSRTVRVASDPRDLGLAFGRLEIK
jgi:hypothetical protein